MTMDKNKKVAGKHLNNVLDEKLKRIPVCEPTIGVDELENVVEAIKTAWISGKGKFVNEFEQEFAKYCNAKHCLTTTSGTTALHLALASLGIGKGDEVICPTFTMAATGFSIAYTGAKPVFVDCDPVTFNIDTTKIEDEITRNTKAIMTVDLYGHPCDYDPITRIARDNGLKVIADSAESHGSKYKGIKVGTLADITCFSFYANKIITMGEGGCITTNSDEIAETAAELKDLAHSKQMRFYHYKIGYNYRLSNILAGIGLAQLKHIDKFIEMRKNNAMLYNALLEDIVDVPFEFDWAERVYWMYCILTENRDKLMERLKNVGIETRTVFIPMHQQPAFRYLGLFKKLPISEDISNRGMYLPSSSHLKEEQIRYICKKVRELV